jgi:hypothetical protein
MARSTYIYLVTADDAPVAAFTVKWEMEWWIAHNPGTYKRFRMSDGTYTDREKRPVEMADK